MPKGGARVNSGPAPNPNALRRDRPSDRDGWTTLPAEGFKGKIPAWPLVDLAGDDAELMAKIELEQWKLIWRTPQAAAWDRLGWVHDVALYVRWLALAQFGDMKAAGEARQWSDRLGLNPSAMLRNRWRVSVDEVTPRKRTTSTVRPAGRVSARERMKAVPGVGGTPA